MHSTVIKRRMKQDIQCKKLGKSVTKMLDHYKALMNLIIIVQNWPI
jgi:hypothetical protein